MKYRYAKSSIGNKFVGFLLSEQDCFCTIPAGFVLTRASLYPPPPPENSLIFHIYHKVLLQDLYAAIFLCPHVLRYQTRHIVAGFCCCIGEYFNVCLLVVQADHALQQDIIEQDAPSETQFISYVY